MEGDVYITAKWYEMTEQTKRQNKIYSRINQKILDTACTFDCMTQVVDADERDPSYNGSMVRLDLDNIEDSRELTNLLRVFSHEFSELEDEVEEEFGVDLRIATEKHQGEYFLMVREVEE